MAAPCGAKTVIVASGAAYRRPPIANLPVFEGAGVSYWASPVEAKLCEGEEIALVGGGNSAGQAVVFLAPRVKRLHLVIRGEGLEASMSRYLIERIDALANVELHTNTEVVALEGNATTGLTGAVFRDRRHRRDPWLLTAASVPVHRRRAECRLARRLRRRRRQGIRRRRARASPTAASSAQALPLETSRPGVFAIGDVRAGSTKRVAAAVGEGAAVVAQIHEVLAESLTGA